MQSGRQPKADDNKEYQKAFRKYVFKLLKMGYDRLDAISLQDSEEEDITGEIVREINDILEYRGSPQWVRNFAVHEELRINDPDRRGKRRKRIDIEFEWVCHCPRHRYPFEAKRLCVNTHPIGEYVGSAGLGEFLSGNYAQDKIEAGMIGYVQSDTPESWAAKVQNKFEKDSEIIKACPDGNWTNITIIGGLTHCFRSKHHRVAEKRPITLYHVSLIFC
ncbi:MAG: hypothetical protein PF690_15175 [Deltaproteobacteria bacterium]|jgi:hypothetical protein|nr:hypothetical protein [Deltaproteobacteria bacterium]